LRNSSICSIEKIADPDGADFPFPIQLVHRIGCFFDLHQRVGPVDLIDVDVIGSKPAQGVLDLLEDPTLAGVAVGIAVLPRQTDFGRDNDMLAAAVLGESRADDLLGATEPVNRRRIDNVDTVVERRPDGGNRLRFVGAAPHPTADGPGADRNA
jgi:hypothetical protein